MGWSLSVAGSHARRLERQGWLERHRMTRGRGSLLVATRRGVRMSGLAVGAPPAPAPTWWAHDCACAWTAAWLSVRGREWRGPREVLADPELKGELEWRTGTGWRRSGHRPDLAVLLEPGRSSSRSSSSARRTSGCARSSACTAGGSPSADGRPDLRLRDDALAKRIAEIDPAAGLPNGALRTELLSTVQAEAKGRRRDLARASLVAFWLCAALGAGGAWLLRRRTTLSVRNLYLVGGATSLLCGLTSWLTVGRAARPRAAGRPTGRPSGGGGGWPTWAPARNSASTS